MLIKYGGGNDFIQGFNETSTLQISSGTLSSVTTNGSDYFLSVGENILTLQGAAQLDKVNIVNAKGKAIKFTVDKNLVGTKGNDEIENYLDGATINPGKGDDYIFNEGANVLFKYGGGADTIYGFNETSTLQISSGTLSSVTTNGTDYFLKVGKNTLRLNGAAQLDKVNIVNSKGKAISFTVTDISVSNKKAGVTFNGTEGNDYLKNSGKKVLLNALAGDDTISNTGASSTINGDSGNDEIYNSGSRVSISGGADNDFIVNGEEGTKVTINGGKGDDFIENTGENVSINAEAGNDRINNFGSRVSVNAGGGDDFINNEGSDVLINVGDGDDEVDNYGSNVTIEGGKGRFDVENWGDNVVVKEGASDDFIGNFGANSSLSGGAGNDFIHNTASGIKVTIDGGKGDDQIINEAANVSINAGKGSDFILNEGSKVTIDAGNGNDTVESGAGNDSINGGKGNDSLWGGAGNDTLIGGDGEDIFIYRANEGTDQIMDYSNGDLLAILNADGSEGGTFTNSSFKNNKLTLAIDGGGKIIFNNVSSGDNFNINGTTYTISGKKLK